MQRGAPMYTSDCQHAHAGAFEYCCRRMRVKSTDISA
jgi:hypothetical protein